MGFVDGTNPMPSAFLSAATATTPAQPNPAYAIWFRQDQSVLSMLISSLSSEVMHLAIGRSTSQSLWKAIEQALASTSHARTLHLLGQLHSLQQGDSSIADYLAKAQVVVEDLALVGRPVTLEEQNLYVFRGLRSEFHPITTSLAVRGRPVSLQELADLLGSHVFVTGAGPDAATMAPTAFVTNRGAGRRPWRGAQQRGAGGQRGGGQQLRSSDGGVFRGGGQYAGRGRGGRTRGRGRSNSWQPKCQLCGIIGHTAPTCYSFVNMQPQAHYTYSNNALNFDSDFNMWIPDTGATNHATPDIAALSTSEAYTGDDTLRVGDGYHHQGDSSTRQ